MPGTGIWGSPGSCHTSAPSGIGLEYSNDLPLLLRHPTPPKGSTLCSPTDPELDSSLPLPPPRLAENGRRGRSSPPAWRWRRPGDSPGHFRRPDHHLLTLLPTLSVPVTAKPCRCRFWGKPAESLPSPAPGSKAPSASRWRSHWHAPPALRSARRPTPPARPSVPRCRRNGSILNGFPLRNTRDEGFQVFSTAARPAWSLSAGTLATLAGCTPEWE